MRILKLRLWSASAALLAGLLAAMTPAVGLRAAEHVVSPASLAERLDAGSAQRAADERALRDLLTADSSRKTLQAAGLDAQQVVQSVSALGDEDLSRLAERARSFEADVAAGALTNQQITYILIALGTAVIILVIVAA